MKHILDKKNVVGIAHGEKWINGKSTGKKAVLVFVEKKEPVENLDPDDIIEKKIDGLPTDVVGKTGTITAGLTLKPRIRAKPSTSRPKSAGNKPRKTLLRAAKVYRAKTTKRIRPVMGGISVSHKKVSAGTIGALFRDRKKRVVMLSNNHVLANTNKSRIGDAIYQPGSYDSAIRPQNVVGGLMAFVKLRNGANQDSAIASVKTAYLPTINRIGRPRGIRAAKLRLKVKKSGRTTRLTKGRIIATKGTFRVEYGRTSYIIKNCIVTTYMSEGGDSGSLLLDYKNRAVGLLFAGSNRVTLHNPIGPIIKQYKLKFL